MKRVMNFGAGPGTLPLPALELAAAEMCDFGSTGMSILEHSHRGSTYDAVHAETKALFAKLLNLPASHEVLFLHGGASLQFAALPLQFLPPGGEAHYVVQGTWGEKAFSEAASIASLVGGGAKVSATVAEKDAGGAYPRVVRGADIAIPERCAYLHITSNETIHGLQYGHAEPLPLGKAGVPLVCDMSSDFLWRPLDVSPFSFIYAGAQKNVGPSGLCVAIVDKSFIAKGRKDLPSALRYDVAMEQDSRTNTPAVFSIYMVRNVLRWLESEGGTEELGRRNEKKGKLLYEAVDRHADMYRCPVDPGSRSYMNAVFRLPTPELEKAFLKGAEAREMFGLKGHRSVGGIRVSMYNAVPVAWVEALASYMDAFAQSQG